MQKILRTLRRSRWPVAACLLLVGVGSHAAAPPGRYATTTDTVTDTVTGLIWQRNVDASSYTWAGAQSYCVSLNLGGWSSGWRLPTIKELQSIVDIRSYNPAIDLTAFPSSPADYFWSSSPSAYKASYPWVVYFPNGTSTGESATNSHRVRCVR